MSGVDCILPRRAITDSGESHEEQDHSTVYVYPAKSSGMVRGTPWMITWSICLGGYRYSESRWNGHPPAVDDEVIRAFRVRARSEQSASLRDPQLDYTGLGTIKSNAFEIR